MPFEEGIMLYSPLCLLLSYIKGSGKFYGKGSHMTLWNTVFSKRT